MSNRAQRRSDQRLFRRRDYITTHLIAADDEVALHREPLLSRAADYWRGGTLEGKRQCIHCKKKFTITGIKALQPKVSNRAIAKALGASHTQVDRDLGTNVPADKKKGSTNKAGKTEAGTNVPSTLSGAQAAGAVAKTEAEEKHTGEILPGAFLFAMPPDTPGIASVSALCMACHRGLSGGEVDEVCIRVLQRLRPGGHFIDAR